MGPNEERIAAKLARVESEMTAFGFWDAPAPSPEAVQNMGAFGQGTMAFAQWLRHVFVPTVRERLDNGGPWPDRSMVGAQAIREFDGVPEADGLCSALSDFDALFPLQDG